MSDQFKIYQKRRGLREERVPKRIVVNYGKRGTEALSTKIEFFKDF